MEIMLYPALRAFIIHKGKVLIIKESSAYKRSPNQGKYDLPGGKISPGERFDLALIREAKEEVGLDIKLGKVFSISEWRPLVQGVEHHIIATFIECSVNSARVKLGKQYDVYKWIKPSDYKKFNLIETLVPAFEDYLDLKNRFE